MSCPYAGLAAADKSEFDAFAHGVDAFGADADFIAEVPFELVGFCAAAGRWNGCAWFANEASTR